MTGLRDRKKEAVRTRLIEAAEELFAQNGIDGTTMEEIAAAADVSVATVYNYFGTKTRLVLAAVTDDTDRMIDEGSAVLAKPGPDPRKAVRKLLAIYVRHLTGWDRRMLGEVMVAVLQPGEAELTAGLVQMDERFIAQLTELLTHYRTAGELADGVDPAEAALLLFSPMITQLFIYLSLEDHTPRELSRQVGRHVDLAFNGLAAKKDP